MSENSGNSPLVGSTVAVSNVGGGDITRYDNQAPVAIAIIATEAIKLLLGLIFSYGRFARGAYSKQTPYLWHRNPHKPLMSSR